jgi:hypothetical protein
MTLTSPTSGQVLGYNGTTWINTTTASPSSVSTLTGVTITSPSNGDLLSYDGDNWINFTLITQQTGAAAPATKYMRLDLSSSEPATCNSSSVGMVALTHLAKICTCQDNGSGVYAWNLNIGGNGCPW